MLHSQSNDRSLDRYTAEINQYPLLTPAEEHALAVVCRQEHDEASIHRLTVANLRFVVKTAHEFRGYGLPLIDLVQEGNLGLVIAVRKFDPSLGMRLVSYAVWWIRAYMQSYIMRTWSLVKLGTTHAQRKLFFRVRSARVRADRKAGDGMRATSASLATDLNVPEHEVCNMEVRLSERDLSLHRQLKVGGGQVGIDLLADEAADTERAATAHEARHRLKESIAKTMPCLNDKERYVIENRLLRDQPPTLKQIGVVLRISRERVRQIEGNIISKLRLAMVA